MHERTSNCELRDRMRRFRLVSKSISSAAAVGSKNWRAASAVPASIAASGRKGGARASEASAPSRTGADETGLRCSSMDHAGLASGRARAAAIEAEIETRPAD